MTGDQWDIIQAQNRQLLMDLFKYAPQLQMMMSKGAFNIRNGELRVFIDKSGNFIEIHKLQK